MTNGCLDELRVEHARYVEARETIEGMIRLADDGGIIPLLAPTRCGKTELIHDLRNRLSEKRKALSTFWESDDFVVATVPPKPNDKQLYTCILNSLGIFPAASKSAPALQMLLSKHINDRQIQTIVLDEFSHCAEVGANFSKRAATDHIKFLVDQTGVRLILAGLPKISFMIEDNEQLRDRAFSTVSLDPYQWMADDERDHYLAAAYDLFDVMRNGGVTLGFDEADMVRRLYGASGGRVGSVVRLLKHALRGCRAEELTFEDVARTYRTTVQRASNVADMFQDEPPTDMQLERSYASIMGEAGLDVAQISIESFGAVAC